MKKLLLIFLSLSLCACGTTMTNMAHESYLQQGKRFFESGFYKRAMQELLPLAADGNREAQYAVGYMYYYGYGVAQDTDVGYFWIQRSADQHYEPAIKALALIVQEKKHLPTMTPPPLPPNQR